MTRARAAPGSSPRGALAAARAAGLALLAALALAAACGEPRSAAPVEPRAIWLAGATPLRVGDVAAIERLVVTPPGWSVAPLAPPAAPAGFWLLDAETLAIEKQASRWIHHTRLRVRAREPGRFRWPAATVAAVAPDGAKRELALDALELEVVATLPEAPDRLTPYGVRELPAAPARSLLAAAAAGAVAALAALALVWLAIRRRRARRSLPPLPEIPPEERARAGLARARLLLPGAPAQAADAISAALRRFAFERHGAPTLASTREELAALPAPLALATRWQGLLALLAALDAERFSPPADAAATTQRVATALAAAEAFVAASQPPAAPR